MRFQFPGLTFILIASIGEGAVEFLEAPSGTVYVPPQHYPPKTVRCVTSEAAHITWVYDDGAVLDPTEYGISRVSDTVSALNVSNEKFRNLPGKAIIQEIHCQAGSATSSKFKFQLGAAPSVETQPSNTTKNETDVAEFSCIFVDTKPTPNVSWLFTNNSGHMMTLEEEMRGPGLRESKVKISPVKRADAGTYRCVVDNEFAIVHSQPGYLIVPYCDGLVTQQTECALGRKFTPSKIVVANGTNVVFNVIACSNPPVADIRLSRSSDGLFFSSSSSNLNRPLGTAMISPNHVQYTFTADWNWNGSLSISARGLADCGTLIVAVSVLEPLGSVDAVTSAICSSAGLQIQWTMSGSGGSDIKSYTLRWGRNPDRSSWNDMTTLSVSDDDSLTQQGGSYTLTELESGVQYCIEIEAANDIGSTKSDVFCNATFAVPDRPIVIDTPVSVAETRLEIRWTVGNNGSVEILKYTVTWSKYAAFTPEKTAKTLSVPARGSLMQHMGTWNLTGLTKGTLYYTKAEATSCVGSSISTVQSFLTRCDPGQPEQPRVLPSHHSSQLMFRVPSFCDCCRITGYIVRDSDDSQLSSSYVVASRTVTVTITGLNERTLYVVRVSAIANRSWEGLLSESVAFNTTANNEAGNEGSISTTTLVLIAVFGGGGGATGTIIIIYIVKKKKKEHAFGSVLVGKDKNNLDSPPASFYMAVVQQKTGGNPMESTQLGASETKESKTGQGPTYIQPEFPRKEDRPPVRMPERPVVYSAVDASATQKLHQEAKTSEGLTYKTSEGLTYVQPQFLNEEDRPPASFPQRPVVYSRVDAVATLKAGQDAELKKQLNNEPLAETSDIPSVEIGDALPVNCSEASSEHDKDGSEQTIL